MGDQQQAAGTGVQKVLNTINLKVKQLTDAITRTVNNIKNKVRSFVNDFRSNGVGAIKTAIKDLKDSIVKSVKRTTNKLMSTFKSKEDFMGLV